jgi:hypothetical protein
MAMERSERFFLAKKSHGLKGTWGFEGVLLGPIVDGGPRRDGTGGDRVRSGDVATSSPSHGPNHQVAPAVMSGYVTSLARGVAFDRLFSRLERVQLLIESTKQQ